MAGTKEYAFLSPGHNQWNVWMSGNSYTMTNPGASHRILESLVYTVTTLAQDGWVVDEICIESGEPKLVMLIREVATSEEDVAAQPEAASAAF